MNHFHPLRLGINHYKEHSSIEWSGKIHMYTLPWASRPDPRVAHLYGCSATVGLTIRAISHSLFVSSSRFGHQTCSRAKDFIRTIPGWLRSSSDSISCRYLEGITTLVPRKKQPSSTVKSSRLAQWNLSSSGVFSSAGQPYNM